MKRIAPIVAFATALAGWEARAHACGGCFHPPNENPTVVTDHRMVFSISSTQSTLYDQIKYTGAPSSFAWVLPYAGDIEVGVSSDVLFNILDSQTQTSIQAPNPNCPGLPSSCNKGRLAIPTSAAGHDEDSNGVTVLNQQVVGPYETVQLSATNPTALNDWLTQHGYAISDDVKPIIGAYQGEHFDFLALKLVPGQGVQSMRPIRVTTKGSNVALPLRMIAAGSGAKIGITLFVVAEGRYEPQNFPFFQIASAGLTWDWGTNLSNYTDLRAQHENTGGGRVWEIESSTTIAPAQIASQVQSNVAVDQTNSVYLPATNDAGIITEPATQVQQDDLAALFAGMNANVRLTRIRADLGHAALDQDLTLAASGDQSELPTVRVVTKEAGEPLCPVYRNCEQDGTAPRSQAGAKTSSNDNSDDGCAVPGERRSPVDICVAIGLGILGIVLMRRHRPNNGRPS